MTSVVKADRELIVDLFPFFLQELGSLLSVSTAFQDLDDFRLDLLKRPDLSPVRSFELDDEEALRCFDDLADFPLFHLEESLGRSLPSRFQGSAEKTPGTTTLRIHSF